MNIRRPQKKTKKELRKVKRKFLTSLFLLIIIIISFIFIMNNSRFMVSSIEIHGNETILDTDIKESIDKVIKRKVLFIPMENVLFVGIKRIERVIGNDFPKIYNTDVSIKDGSKLIISIEERKPHSLWCKYNDLDKTKKHKNNDLQSFDEECYFADQRGFIYTRAPYFSGGIFKKIYTTDKLLKIGEQILDKEEFINFFKFIDSLNSNFGITVDHIFLNEHNETRIYMNSLLGKKLDNSPYIIYHTNEDYKIIVRNMELMINHKLFKKDFSEKPDRLKFIDLRIIDQIRYKFITSEEYVNKEE